jgi:5-methylcytosine-specific restriction protein A
MDRVERPEQEVPGTPPRTAQEARRLRWHLRAEGRSRTAAKEAKRLLGYTCMVCDFTFEAMYGEIGKEYIEAHHLTLFSKLDERPRDLDPAHDFAVVCANCHRMLHQKIEPWTIEELRGKIRR